MKSLLLVFWTVCLLLNGLAASAQELVIDARFEVSTVITTGSGAKFICRATNFNSDVHTILSFTWRHNGSVISISEAKYRESAESNHKRSLYIGPTMVLGDAGSYRCTIQYTMTGQSLSAYEEATLNVGIKAVTIVDPKQYGVIGRPAELRCNATGIPTPTIFWYKGESINFNNFLGESKGPSGVYSVPTVQASDAGNYTCNGATSGTSDEKLIEFIVLTPPVVDVSQRNHSAFYGATLTLDCPINENATIASPLFPRPLYSWSFTSADGGPAIPVSQETSSRHSVDPESGALSVTEVTFGDIGQYKCSVRNEAGEGSGVFDVDVPSSPMITLENPPSVRAVNGSRVLMDCPYISNPLPTVSWFKGGSSEPLPTQSSKYRVYQNGTLVISDFRLPSDYASYRCELTNTHGTDSLTYTLQIWDTPLGPSSLTLNFSPRSDRRVTLTWTAPPTGTTESAIRRELEFYVIEQSLNGGEYVQVEEVGAAVTTITLTQLLPGEKYDFRVRGGNFAGLGTSSVIASHRPAPRKPSLSSFQAMPLADGRSVLVTWDLEYDGGPNITKFTIEVEDESGAVLTLLADVSVEKLTITDLEPETRYTFTALAVNSLGSDSLHATQNTTTALPAQPSSLAVNLLSVGTYSLSFSLRQGSQSITHFLVNYTLINSPEPPSQFVLAIDDSTHISSMEEIDSSRVTDTEYEVVVRVTGLKQSGEYEFRVAGRSGLGNGEFSDWAWCEKNENVIYVTIAVVMGGMVLVIVVILVAVMIAVCRRRLTRGRKIAINGHGFPRPPIDMEDNSDAFVLKSPPPCHHKQGSFHRTPPIIVSSSTDDKEGFTSSFSFSNGYPHSTASSVTKLNTQTSISGTNLDTVVDVPNNDLNIRIVKDFHSSTKSVPNTNGCTPPGDVNRQHLCLQTSLNSMNLENGEHTDGRSVVSVRNYLYVPTKSQDGNTPLSKSSPEINRLSCDSVLDTMATSYMTDV